MEKMYEIFKCIMEDARNREGKIALKNEHYIGGGFMPQGISIKGDKIYLVAETGHASYASPGYCTWQFFVPEEVYKHLL